MEAVENQVKTVNMKYEISYDAACFLSSYRDKTVKYSMDHGLNF